MQYISTRGESPPIGFLDAVLAGLAPDGGLYSPAVWPSFSPEEIGGFAGRPYAEVAAAVLSKFAGPAISHADLEIQGALIAEITVTRFHQTLVPHPEAEIEVSALLLDQ